MKKSNNSDKENLERYTKDLKLKDYLLKLSDINLSICFVDINKNIINLEFLNMYDGNEICTISMSNIITLEYDNSLNEEDVLPAYIGELEVSKKLDNGFYYLNMRGWIDLSLTSINCVINYPELLS